jgi:hypothetical protein
MYGWKKQVSLCKKPGNQDLKFVIITINANNDIFHKCKSYTNSTADHIGYQGMTAVVENAS